MKTVPFSEEDKHLIQFYRKATQLGAHRAVKLFAEMKWTLSGLQKLLTKINTDP